MSENGYKYIGKPRRMVDGLEKVTGYMKFTADLQLAGLLHARPILSPYAHAKIESIDTEDALEMPGVVAVLTADDLPTAELLIQSRNSAVLARDEVLWMGQPVAVVVAETEIQAADAAELVYVDYEPLPVVADLLEALEASSAVVWPNGLPGSDDDMSNLHADTGDSSDAGGGVPNNVSKTNQFGRGDAAAGLAEADVVITRRYRSRAVHQAYLEPHSAVATLDPLGRNLTVYSATQGHHYVGPTTAKMVGLSQSQLTLEPMPVGGGFGAKYGILEPLVSAVALAVRQPVKMVLTRAEDMQATTPAPDIVIDLSVGARNDGSLAAIKADIYVDNGIFSFNHGGLVSLGLGGYYKCENVELNAFEVHTHKSQAGAYRAPGLPQATFALESTIDDIANVLGIDPLQFRIQNGVDAPEHTMGIGRPWGSHGLQLCLQRLSEHPIMSEQLGADEGVGIAIGGWPPGVANSEAICRVTPDGKVHVQSGHVDVSGNNSSFVLIAAEVLGVTPDDVFIENGNSNGPFAPGSGGSQVTYSVAGAIRDSAEKAREKLLEVAADEFEASAQDIELVDGEARVRGVPDKGIKIGKLASIARNKRGGRGPIVAEGHSSIEKNAAAFTVHAVKARVDRATGIITPLHHVAIQDVGFAINPMMVEGQMHGGMLQGVAMGLQEMMSYDENGSLVSGTFMDYSVPQIDQAPTLEAIALNNPSDMGPFGARGIGEPPIIPGAAALANAVKNAVGVRMTEMPMRQEQVWQALQDQA